MGAADRVADELAVRTQDANDLGEESARIGNMFEDHITGDKVERLWAERDCAAGFHEAKPLRLDEFGMDFQVDAPSLALGSSKLGQVQIPTATEIEDSPGGGNVSAQFVVVADEMMSLAGEPAVEKCPHRDGLSVRVLEIRRRYPKAREFARAIGFVALSRRERKAEFPCFKTRFFSHGVLVKESNQPRSRGFLRLRPVLQGGATAANSRTTCPKGQA